MERHYYDEMVENVAALQAGRCLEPRTLFVFGHCHATEMLVDCLRARGYTVQAILDNNPAKYGRQYRGVPIVAPAEALGVAHSAVLIASRFVEAMRQQLQDMGFSGTIYKVVDYNTYADYSLSSAGKQEKLARVETGKRIVKSLRQQYGERFRIFCPFAALGDIYIMMAYLPAFLRALHIADCVLVVAAPVLRQVIALFGDYAVAVLPPRELDACIQAELALSDAQAFIAHQDRPYIVNLHLALQRRCIPLRQIYCQGVFALPPPTPLAVPMCWQVYRDTSWNATGKAVILSPYAKSVVALPMELWTGLVQAFRSRGYAVYTNVAGEEQPLTGTLPLSPRINEMKSAVEQAGLFIGLRSGLCDLLITAQARCIALYPEYYYSDTPWRAREMYSLPEFTANIEVRADDSIAETVARIFKVADQGGAE